jgi:two-component system, NarL family, sensor kinase
VDLSLPQEMVRLRADVEIALFRALQEGLTNVHRHSGSSAVGIRVRLNEKDVHLEIEDDGRGMPHPILKRLLAGAAETGVGIAGMRERIRELGGSLGIESDSSGTLLTVSIPIYEPAGKIPGNSDNQQTQASAA